ncbi:MAG: hypothetical protein WCA93_01080 [Acidimicrobiia bacterium]
MDSRKLPGWAIPLAVALGVVALVAIGLARKPVDLADETPEGTVQAYLNAVAAMDYQSAASYWDEGGCLPSTPDPGVIDANFSASLVSVEVRGSEATVIVSITQGSGDVINGYTEYQEWFNLVSGDDGWRIRQPSWPYYNVACEEQK